MYIGRNILNTALAAIGKTKAAHLQFRSRELDDQGVWINQYYPSEIIHGSFQPVPVERVKAMGFDTSLRYFNLYTSNDLSNVHRGEAPDQVIIDCEVYETVGTTDWMIQNGWKGLLLVKQGGN